MKVETYEATEMDIESMQPEDREEATRLCEELGLTGQERFTQGNDSDAPAIPYRKMTATELNIYSTLLPKTMEISEYSEGPIPLRVLQVIAHAKSMFDHLKIWCPENADIRDPLLVGYIGSEYNGERFILARWGEVLDDISTLARTAGAMSRDKAIIETKKIIERASAHLKSIEQMTPEQAIATGKLVPSYFEP